jgi:hypothetical protein
LDIINYIKISLQIIIELKVKEEVEKNNKEKEDKNLNNENTAEDYETLLRKEEAEIRQHISVEHQFKLHFDNFSEKISDLENDNYILTKKIVNHILNYIKIIIFNISIGKTKKKI